jgi:hypothetical protein
MANVLDLIADGRKGIGIFLGGVLFGTAGICVLKSEDAKKVYVQGTAAALRGKEEFMTTATALRENCEDIYAEAVGVNEKRAAKKAASEEIIEDTGAAVKKKKTGRGKTEKQT